MNINVTLFGQMITFGLFVWFCMKFVWPLLTNAMAEREATIADGLAKAERGRHEGEQAQARANEVLEEAKDQAREVVAQAQRRADEIVEEAKGEARVEGDRLLTAARAEIEQEMNQAREQLRGEVVKLALVGAKQVMMREVDASAHGEALDKLAAQL